MGLEWTSRDAYGCFTITMKFNFGPNPIECRLIFMKNPTLYMHSKSTCITGHFTTTLLSACEHIWQLSMDKD